MRRFDCSIQKSQNNTFPKVLQRSDCLSVKDSDQTEETNAWNGTYGLDPSHWRYA